MPHPQSRKARAAKAKRKEERSKPKDDHDAEKHAERERRRAEGRAARRHQERLGRLRLYGIVGALVAAVVIGGWLMFRPGPELAGVESPPSDGRGHLEGATYQTGSPTSGAHNAGAPRCGAYPSPLPKDLAVHSLEHGTVVLWYDISNPALGSELSLLMAGWESHVIVTPSSELDAPIVATAWNRRMRFNEVTAEVGAFIDAYRNRGPERVPCNIS